MIRASELLYRIVSPNRFSASVSTYADTITTAPEILWNLALADQRLSRAGEQGEPFREVLASQPLSMVPLAALSDGNLQESAGKPDGFRAWYLNANPNQLAAVEEWRRWLYVNLEGGPSEPLLQLFQSIIAIGRRDPTTKRPSWAS
jgi:hypothetical protein